MKQKLIDAQEMHRKHPTTFEVPTPEELSSLQPGDFVKICAHPERFWCEVKTVSEEAVTGIVSNDLIFTEAHGYADGEIVDIHFKNIYSILKAETIP